MERGGPKILKQTFKIDYDTWQAKELLIESFLKEGSNPRFHLSLRDFTNNVDDH